MATAKKSSAAQTSKKVSAAKPAKKTTKPAVRKTATKKPVTKAAAAKKSSAAKTSKKVLAAKTAKKVDATSVAKSSALSPLDRLRSINLSSAILGLIFSVLVVALVGSASAELLLGHQARDAFANLDSVVLGSASEVLVNVEYRFLLVAALVTGAIGSLLIATKLRSTYEAGVKAGVPGLRWLFMGVSAALTLEFVSFIGGVQDIAVLKSVAALVLATVLFGWLSDRENVANKDAKWLAFVAAIFTGVMAWMPLLGSLIGTSVYGGERFGWHVYALAGVILAGFIGFAINQRASIKKKAQLEYTFFEQRYLRIDQVTKFLIILITVAALQK